MLRKRKEAEEQRLDYRASVLPTLFSNAFKGKSGTAISFDYYFPSLKKGRRGSERPTKEELKAKFRAAFPRRGHN